MMPPTMPEASPSMDGKVCVVTGATSGIGTETVRALALSGATTVLHCRDAVQGERLRDDLRAQTGNPKVDFVVADFTSLAEVRKLAAELLERWPRLDVLINNAGAIQTDRKNTRDGFELTIGVNHLAPFLLTHLLLDRLKAGAPSRVVNVASKAHYRS